MENIKNLSYCKAPVILVRILWNVNSLDRFSKNVHISNLMKNHSVEAELFHADWRTGGQTDRHKEADNRFSKLCERPYKLWCYSYTVKSRFIVGCCTKLIFYVTGIKSNNNSKNNLISLCNMCFLAPCCFSWLCFSVLYCAASLSYTTIFTMKYLIFICSKFRALIRHTQFFWKDQQIHPGYTNVILLHSNQRHVSAPHVAIFMVTSTRI
jgi:hypothetical protein